jgi:GH25 family lysozyme M1 (1,4-beta-N-acetylmuramidase)
MTYQELLDIDRKTITYDISDYEQKIEWGKVPAFVTDVVIKAGGSGTVNSKKYLEHAQGAHAAGKRVHLYYWNDPSYKLSDPATSATDQAKHFLSLAQKVIDSGVPVRSLSVDAEHWWADWNIWKKYRGTKEEYKIPTVPGAVISENTRMMTDYLKKHTSIKVIVYSANWFINGYSKAMLTWLPKEYIWLAEYLYDGPDLKTTWADVQSKYSPAITRMPKLPAGCTPENLVWWQWTGDYFLVEGVWSVYQVRPIAIDGNVYRGQVPAAEFFGAMPEATKPQLEDDPGGVEMPVFITLENKARALNVPYIPQIGPGADKRANDCGAACGAMITGSIAGAVVTPDDFFFKTGVVADQYLSMSQVMGVLKSYGVQSEYAANATPGRLYELLASGRPVMCLIRYKEFVEAGLSSKTFQGFHFIVAVGFTTDSIIIHDPLYEGVGGKYVTIPNDVFFAAWKAAGLEPLKNPACAYVAPVMPIGTKLNGSQVIKRVKVNASNGLKIRSTPVALTNDSNKVGAMKNGEPASIIKEQDGWGLLSDYRGWISLAFTVPA